MFIILISVVTLGLLVVGAITLYKDNSSSFSGEGYIISSTTKSNTKYYFSANTKYKLNADSDIAFKDNNSKSIAVDQASFVHYLNGNIGYLKRGALVNLDEINSSMLNYYNVTDQNLIESKDSGYSLSVNGNDVNVSAFVGRISDNKYIIAGKDLKLQIPDNSDKITGDYFEVLFIEEGVVKIDNQEASYQVTAQDSYIYVGDNIIINLGNEKIYYDGEAKMLLSQITINGDENINLDVSDKNAGGGGTGTGDGNGSGNVGDDNGENNATGDDDGVNGDNNSNGDNNTGDGTDNSGNTGSDTGDDKETNTGSGNTGTVTKSSSAQIELISADVTSTVIDLSLQLNNATAVSGNLVAYLTNVANGNREYAKNIDLVNGTFNIRKESLAPNTEYTLSIVETGIPNEKQYFQKTFKTNELGLALERQYATDSSLSYGIIFDENTEVSKVKLSIYDSNGSNADISPNQFIVSASDISSVVEFTGLKSNSSYSVSIDEVWINNASYSNVYTINRIDTTLKKTPVLSSITVTPNSEEVKFNIKLNKIDDPDKAIISYTYNIYLADDITLDGEDPTPVYSVVKNDSDALDLNLNEINELKTGIDYRCQIVAQYNDNEMVREVASDYSANFLLKSKPNIAWTQISTSVSEVVGTITLIDANCSVPVNGRACLSEANNFTLRYYRLGEDENSSKDTVLSFNNNTLSSGRITFSELSSDTTYVVKVYGNYYDDEGNIHRNVQLGDSFYITTDESETLKLKVIGDNKSGYNKDGSANSANVVTFDAVLASPQDEQYKVEPEDVASLTMNLYKGSYNVSENLIGTYVMDDTIKIQDFFSSFTITNSLFTNGKLGKLDSLAKMIEVTNNSTNTLNGTYTVEIVKVLYPDMRTEYKVEDNIYTFKLTPEYYLDSRIEINPSYKYINVTTITKKNLTEDERILLSKTVSNLDELNDDTIVGIAIENSLSDAFVDSAFTYDKVIVDYVIYNNVTKREIKRISVDMGNKYQPKTQTIYLDSTELDDGKRYFTRGYTYKLSYELNFKTEDGENPTYTNARLAQNLSIDRQSPIYSQYISKSTANSVTYRYSISDIDNALYDKKFYYTTASSNDKNKSDDDLVVDDSYHDITIPIDEMGEYSLYYNRRNTSGTNTYVEFAKSEFEAEYTYDNKELYSIINDSDNTLKIKINDSDITDRAAGYRVSIKAKDNSGLGEYIRFFLASRLLVNESENEEDNYKYIAIDYANIYKYMNRDLVVSVDCYYDSGLVGFNQTFDNGLILENKVKSRYLNIYNSGSDTVSTDSEEASLNGIYMLRDNYEVDSNEMHIYNYLQDTKNYNAMTGASYYNASSIDSNIGINYNLSFTNNGIVFKNGQKEYSGYNAKVLKVANLVTSNNNYRFDSITPKISLDTSGSTINSIKLKVNATGVYGQFVKDGKQHNKFYIEIYGDADLTNKLTTIDSDITIVDNSDGVGATAVSEEVVYSDLIPNTTYYVAIYAYLNGQYTRLYDLASRDSYVVKTYEAKTLDANGVLEKITYSVLPSGYNNESSNKKLSWRLKLKDVNNYKVRFELFDKEGKVVNFDGSMGNSCSVTDIGDSAGGYVKGCYIQVDKDNLKEINNVDQVYEFTGDNFVFGGEYYKLIVYAVPYTKGQYDENNKLILYENDALSTTGDKTVSDAPNYNITIPTLAEATFNLNNTLFSGYRDDDGYFIEFTPTVNDPNYVMNFGKYYVTLRDEKQAVVERKEMSALLVNESVTFSNLSSNTLYYVELSYTTYRNNNGYTEAQKTATTPFTDFIYTPIDAGITLGTITAQQSGNQKIILTYNGASNMTNNIVRAKYTVSLKGGSSKASGEYVITSDVSNIFTIAADKTPRLTIDLALSDDTSFSLRSGNTYIISTQYWYMEDGEEVQLMDQNTGNTTFTTILNL